MLEQYALVVAAHFIEFATSAEQASLICFLRQINQNLLDADQVSDEVPTIENKSSTESPFDQLLRQWQTALRYPDLSAYPVPDMAMNHDQIEATSFLLDKLNHLTELAGSKRLITSTRNTLFAYYRALHEKQATDLKKLKDLYEESLLILHMDIFSTNYLSKNCLALYQHRRSGSTDDTILS